ncbi:lytic murein transglycosylase [Hyphomonas sp.]|uniref:lytic murein transglycosylase n=1 Tax=Hyphomonas sp. TaxID=87 RepID=UPI00391D65C8
MLLAGWNRSKWMATAAICGLLASCANGPPLPPSPKPGPVVTAPVPETGPIQYASSGHAAMDTWRKDFSARAIAAGHDRALVKSMLKDIRPLPLWLGTEVQAATAPSAQAEFAKPIWEYLRVPLGTTRINTGQAKLAELSGTLAQIEARYGVDRQVLLAIWGMETSYGGFMGTDDAPNALANMAVEGRRQKFAEDELYALMTIVEKGYAKREDLGSGWAGAMGHTQFMPSTYIAHAVDFDGDGKRDVWKSQADALASAANYLARSGYVKGQPWGLEVTLPADFDYSLADGSERRMETWVAAGLSPITGGAFDTNGAEFAELWVPAGHQGPKYLLFKNFNVFKTYNRADSYAFAVGLSGDAIMGKRGPLTAWPTHLTPLTVAEIKDLQTALNERGFDAGAADGIAGRRTKLALAAFQKTQGQIADGYPTKQVLASLTSPQVSGAGTN